MPPVHLRLLSRRRFESPHSHPLRRLALWLQPIFENRVTTPITAGPQLPQQYLRIPHARFLSFFDVRLERIQLAPSSCSRTIGRSSVRLQQVLSDRLAIESQQP